MLRIFTRPREIIARFVRKGDFVAMYAPDSAGQLIPVRSVITAETRPVICWYRVADVPILVPADKGIGVHRLVLVLPDPDNDGQPTGAALEMYPTEGQQLVIREEIVVDGWFGDRALEAYLSPRNDSPCDCDPGEPERCGTWVDGALCARSVGHKEPCAPWSQVVREVIADDVEGQPAAPAGITTSGIIPSQTLPQPGAHAPTEV